MVTGCHGKHREDGVSESVDAHSHLPCTDTDTHYIVLLAVTMQVDMLRIFYKLIFREYFTFKKKVNLFIYLFYCKTVPHGCLVYMHLLQNPARN